MTYTIRKVDGAKNAEVLRALHTLTFPADEHVEYGDPEGRWWLAYRDSDGEPVAFAGTFPSLSEERGIYMSRCGVLADHRGQGLQKRLLQARIRYARASNASCLITTTYENPPSGNNLIKAGFRMYTPSDPWCREGTDYWKKTL